MAEVAEFVVLVGACVVAGGLVGLAVGITCIIGDLVIEHRERRRRREVRRAMRASVATDWVRKTG